MEKGTVACRSRSASSCLTILARVQATPRLKEPARARPLPCALRLSPALTDLVHHSSCQIRAPYVTGQGAKTTRKNIEVAQP